MKVLYFAILSATIIVYINGMPHYQQTTGSQPAWKGTVGARKSQELNAGLTAIKDEQFHLEESAKKHPLHPAQITHKIGIAKANRSFNKHNNKLRQLRLAEGNPAAENSN